MKRLVSALVALLLSLAGSFPALAQLKTWEQQEEAGAQFLRFTIWGSELPQMLGDVLKEAGYGALPCLSGAMWERVEKEKGSVEASMALVALQGTSGPVAIGMSRASDTRQWALDDMGSKAFLPGQDFTIQAFGKGPHLGPCLSIDYAPSGGGLMRYELGPNGFQRSWTLKAYSFQDATGQGIQIIGDDYPDYGFRVRSLPEKSKKEDPGTYYPAFFPLTVRYMKGGIGDYPTTEARAREISQATQDPFEGKKLAVLLGANLREKPTGKSKSLGVCQPGALALVLGEEKGRDYPWVHLRLGEVEGYMSGVYVKQVGDESFFCELRRMPPPLARAKCPCILRQKPGQSAKTVTRLPAGTQMHVLSVTSGGYYQVMVPRGEPDWMMDVEGTSGYVKAQEVEVVSGSIAE